jgi:glycosyltransferase involved in cell wall biosynthesis
MASTDLFFLPTAGENFGHAIFEALSTGAPVLISDQTPWRGLAASMAGWDLPLTDRAPWVEAIESFARLPEAQRIAYRQGAASVARKWFHDSGAVERNAHMLTATVQAAK